MVAIAQLAMAAAIVAGTIGVSLVVGIAIGRVLDAIDDDAVSNERGWSNEQGRCGDGLVPLLGPPVSCTLTHGHAGQHHDHDSGAYWNVLEPCPFYAVDRRLVINCALPAGHPGHHECGDVDWAMAR